LTSSGTALKGATILRPGTELELDFTDILANGQGVGRASGMVVFCFGPLPGERARVRVATVKQRYAVADLIALLEESPARVLPFCPVFGECGGCQLQHLAYDAQLRWKRDVVRNTLTRIAGVAAVSVNETIGMREPRAYRNKMSLVVDRRAKPPALGFYRQRSHDVVAIDGCPIVAPQLDATIGTLVRSRSRGAVGRALRDARHLVARAARASGEAVLTVTTAVPMNDAAEVGSALLGELPGLAGIENSFDLSGENAILGRQHRLLAGKGEIEETICGLRYRISPASFFQVNVEILERIFAFVEPWLQPPAAIVDAYCGAGTFSLFFARHGWSVYGIEENRHAVAEAQENARLNGLQERVAFDTGRVERMLALPRGAQALRRSRVVFLDPPRKGCDPAVLAAIAGAAVAHVWYLSCDAATLARDLKFLISNGYRFETVQPFDMFPQTGHVETLVRMEYAAS
jgi:23S rRNA (uracil1939-C5)-methyltransferase